MKLFKLFRDSANEFKNLRSVLIAALLIAIHTVLTYLTISITDTVRISVAFVANCVIGVLYGPVVGFVCAGLGDIIGFLLKPNGPFFIGWTLSAALSGLCYGIAFYKKFPKTMDAKKISDRLPEKQNVNYIYLILTNLLLFAGFFVWFLTPFLTVTTKATKENPDVYILTEGTAFHAVKTYFFTDGSLGACILAILILVMFIVLIVLNLRKKMMLSILLSAFSFLAILLTVYTDKKIMSGHYGFFTMVLIFGMNAILNLAELLRQKSVDRAYLLRCFIVMMAVTVLINILLGTYWISFMYGKAFMFYLPPRLVKNIIQLPFNTVLAYLVLKAMKHVRIPEN